MKTTTGTPTPADTVLRTWAGLNNYLREADEEACKHLLKAELKSPRKSRVIAMRIHSRLNAVRAQRERLEINKKTGN